VGGKGKKEGEKGKKEGDSFVFAIKKTRYIFTKRIPITK